MDPVVLIAVLMMAGMGLGGMLLLKGDDYDDMLVARLKGDSYAKAFEKARERSKKSQGKNPLMENEGLWAKYKASFQVTLSRFDTNMSVMTFIVFFNLGAWISATIMHFMYGFHFVVSVGISYFGLFFLLNIYLRRRERKRIRSFLLSFPNVLDFIIRGVRSGLPLSNQVHLIPENFEEPVRGLFKKVSSYVRLGFALHEALERVGEEMRLAEFHLFVIAIKVQQQAGGNISDSLKKLADMMRKRIEIMEKLRTQTSQIRASGYVVFSMPLLVFVLVSILQPGYFEPLFTTQLGSYLLMASAGLVFLAVITMNIIMKERF